jgi:WD40 repeat protein
VTQLAATGGGWVVAQPMAEPSVPGRWRPQSHRVTFLGRGGRAVREQPFAGRVGLSGDGTRAVVVRRTSGVRAYDLSAGGVIADVFTHPVRELAVAADGSEFAVQGDDGGEIGRWELPGGWWRSPLRCDDASFHRLEYSPGGRWLLATSDGLLRLWDRTAEYRPHDIEVDWPEGGDFLAVPSPDDWAVAVLQRAGAVLDLLDGSSVPLAGFTGRATAADYSPDGRLLAVGSDDGAVRVWDARSGEPLREYRWDVGRPTAVRFARDGLTCAAGGDGGAVVVWDVDP